MAKQLSKSGISDGQTIQPGQVTQSIDAFTGIEDYDITVSGSLTITGPTNINGNISESGQLFASIPFSNNTNFKTLVYDDTSGRFYRTGSYSTGGSGGPTPSLEAVTTAGNTTSNSITTGPITSTGQISASGNLFTNVDDSSLVLGAPSFKVVTYDPATGRFYRTGSFSSVLVSSGSKINFGTDEIVYDDGNGGEGVGIKGTGSKTVEITDKDGNGGKLDVGGGDGNGEIMIGDSGDIRGGGGKGKLTPGPGDGEWKIEKENGTKGEISANVKAGTNTTLIDDSIVLSEPTGQIITTGSVITLSNFEGGGLELTPTAGGNGGNINVTNVGGGGTGLVHINASGSITASSDISGSGRITGDQIIGNIINIRNGTVLSSSLGGHLTIGSSRIIIDNLPSTDPGVLDQLYTTAIEGVRVIAISDG